MALSWLRICTSFAPVKVGLHVCCLGTRQLSYCQAQFSTSRAPLSACDTTLKHATTVQVMSSQMSHARLPGPGCLQASVCLVTLKQGDCWHTAFKPGFVVRNQIPAVMYLQQCSYPTHEPSMDISGGGSADVEGRVFAIDQAGPSLDAPNSRFCLP